MRRRLSTQKQLNELFRNSEILMLYKYLKSQRRRFTKEFDPHFFVVPPNFIENASSKLKASHEEILSNLTCQGVKIEVLYESYRMGTEYLNIDSKSEKLKQFWFDSELKHFKKEEMNPLTIIYLELQKGSHEITWDKTKQIIKIKNTPKMQPFLNLFQYVDLQQYGFDVTIQQQAVSLYNPILNQQSQISTFLLIHLLKRKRDQQKDFDQNGLEYIKQPFCTIEKPQRIFLKKPKFISEDDMSSQQSCEQPSSSESEEDYEDSQNSEKDLRLWVKTKVRKQITSIKNFVTGLSINTLVQDPAKLTSLCLQLDSLPQTEQNVYKFKQFETIMKEKQKEVANAERQLRLVRATLQELHTVTAMEIQE